jgi:PTH1 family peptidyl-tRNA hydrolase
MLMMPMTFMNRSGLSVGEAATFHKIPVEEVLVLVDDIALPVGRIRLRAEGGAGGHNGLLDIERALGTKAYPRLRIGIDLPGRVPQKDYVLGRFAGDQLTKLDHALNSSCDAVACWVSEGIDKAMTRFNAD